MDWGAIFSAFGTLGGIGGIATLLLIWPRLRKMRADTKKVDIDAALAQDAAQDAAWRSIIEVQTAALLGPMRDELKRQGEHIKTQDGRITELEVQLTAARAKYWVAIRWIRAALLWAHRWHPNSKPEVPALPVEIQADV